MQKNKSTIQILNYSYIEYGCNNADVIFLGINYFNTDIYIFCSYNKRDTYLTICGWIDKVNFVKNRKFYPKGTTRTRFNGTSFRTFSDLYEIDNKYLNDVSSIDDLKKQIKFFNN